ncbi:MAG TPA: class I SAM-dependent methyltransferase, partial [Gemmataceae bacterium]
MLPRTLEPEVMDSPEEARDYDSMDHAEVNRRFVDDFIAFWSGEPISPILDVGTGTAQIPVEFCKRCDSIRVVGIDAAASMLAVAAQNVLGCVFATGACIELQQADAKALPFPGGLFGAVMSNSIVHHIPEPSAVIGEMVRVVQPGGLIFVRDLLRPADEATLDRLVNQYAGGAN